MSVDRAAWRGRRRAQRGSLLLEFMVVAVLGLVLAVWAGHEWAQRARALQARSLAVWMGVARDAAEAFLARHAADLADAGAADALAGQGYADWMAPRWDELRAAGLLAGGWQATGPLRRTLGMRVMREGNCPGASCRIWALVHAWPALRMAAGGVDEALVAEWLQAAAGRGLVIWPHRPGFLSGAGLRVRVKDAASPIREAVYSLDATEWKPVLAADGLLDGRSETLSIAPSSGETSGAAKNPGGLLLLRVTDAAFNVTTFNLSQSSPSR